MRRRLVLVAAATTGMVAIAFLVPLAFLVGEIARDRALDAAEREAQSLAPVLALTDDVDALEVAVAATQAGANGRLTVFLDDRTVGAAADPDDRVALARTGRAFNADSDEGVEVFVPVALPDRPTAVVRVSVPSSALDDGVLTSWTVLGLLGVALVLIAVFVADRMARTVTGPVDELAGAAGRLGEGQLDVRVEPRGPEEIAALARSFNRTVERLRALVGSEREAVADLSHRLRTPLTALRLEAGAVPDAAQSERLVASIEGMNRAVTEIIEEARRPVRQAGGAVADAGVVARERAEYWGALADEQGRPWRVDVDVGEHLVSLPKGDLEAALDALLGNVFAHTPEGTPFEVRATAREGRCLLAVQDEGPGVPSPDVAERGVSGGGSTGLGLDIARRAAEAAGGRLRFDEGDRGFSVVLDLPLA